MFQLSTSNFHYSMLHWWEDFLYHYGWYNSVDRAVYLPPLCDNTVCRACNGTSKRCPHLELNPTLNSQALISQDNYSSFKSHKMQRATCVIQNMLTLKFFENNTAQTSIKFKNTNIYSILHMKRQILTNVPLFTQKQNKLQGAT